MRVNRDYLYFRNENSLDGHTETVPGTDWPFLYVDYAAGKTLFHILAPRPLCLGTDETASIRLRTWTGVEQWTTASWLTNLVIDSANPFHGLPASGAVTLDVYRITWTQPSYTGLVSCTIEVTSTRGGTNSDQLYLLRDLAGHVNDPGYGSNNWLIGSQCYGPDYGGHEYAFWLQSDTAFANFNFEEGQPTSLSNIPSWFSWGESPNAIYHAADAHSPSTAIRLAASSCIFQDWVCSPFSNYVAGAYVFSPASGMDRLSGTWYGELKMEYYDTPRSWPALLVYTAALFTADRISGGWSYLSVTGQAPADARFGRITLALTTQGTGTGAVYWDDAMCWQTQDEDRNFNLLPDVWEIQYFGSPTNAAADADVDHDGMNNRQEFTAGTDPTNGLSRLRVETPYGLPDILNQIVIPWPSVSNKRYAIVRTTNLPPAFHVVASNIVATPPLNTHTDVTAAGAGPYYYRIKVE